MTGQPVDMTELNEIMENDASLIKECFKDFLEDYPDLITTLKAAAKSADFEKIDNTAHKLKGALKYLAAEPAAQAALAVEAAGRNCDPDGLDKKIFVLENHCKNVIRFIHIHL